MQKIIPVIFLIVLVAGRPLLGFGQNTLSGKIVFEGTPPSAEKVDVKSDIGTCGTVQEVQPLVLGEGKGIANAVVAALGVKGDLTAQEGILDQVNCQFVPHVQVLSAGSILKITSSDTILHSAHGFYEDGSTAFNIAVPIVGMEVPIKMKQTGVIRLRCDAGHTWMSAYVVVTDQPYYAVTDLNGNFTIEGLPAGTYEIEIWHEWLGRHRRSVEVKGGDQTLTLAITKS